jgi:mycothiol synthase
MASARFFNPTDDEYAAIVALYGRLWSDEKQFGVAQWRENDEEWPEETLLQRFVLEEDGRIMGIGSCYEKYWESRPGTVHIDFHVDPVRMGEGLDKLLYNTIMDYLGELAPVPEIVATEAREDRPDRLEFLRERGYVAGMRSPRSSLKLADFDSSRIAGLAEKIAAKGVDIYTLSELYEREADWKLKLYDLRWAIMQDVPAVEPRIRHTMAEFQKMTLNDPALEEEAWFVAIDNSGAGIWVGMSNLWLNDPTRRRLDVGLTGVIRAYRRRGIATALKLRTIAFAQQAGAETIETDNEENNPMFDLNLKLGFRPKAAWVSYRRKFSTTNI